MSVSKLCEEMVQAGIDLEVLTTTANGESELSVKANFKKLVDKVPVTYFRRITKDPSHFSPALLIYLCRLLRKRGFAPSEIHPSGNICKRRIIHIHAWWNLVSVGSCILAVLLSHLVILSPRGTLSRYSFTNRNGIIKNLFHLIFGKALLKRCHFHVTSEKEKQDIFDIVQPKSITVIPNFVNLKPNSIYSKNSSTYLDFTTIKPDVLKLLFLSRIEEKKGLNLLFCALRTTELPYHLTIAGTGDKDYITSLKRYAAKIGIDDQITWLGQQNNDEKFAVLANHDLMILPSHDESFANVVIESLSVGTPVLISTLVGLADYVQTNNFGWIYANNTGELNSALCNAYFDTDRRIAIRKNAPKAIRRDYDSKCLVNSYIEMYNNLLKPNERLQK
jgi:glycosyltransferase involved in cell wall biosynthesis